jgi:hypothetical protein
MLALSRPSRLLGVALAAALLSVAVLAAAAQAQTTGTAVPPPASFTSTFSVSSDGGMVPGGGTSGATGVFNLQLDSTTNTICHDITISNVTPPFESPAPTATHIHMGAPGEAGPAVWLFNDPQPRSDGSLRSTGCLREAFTSDGQGLGFTVADIEANPAAFYVDNHTTANPSGSVRGQFPGAVSVEVPSIATASPLIDLGLDAAGELEVPEDFDLAGWFTGGGRPGEAGAPLVIAGHVDSFTGPAVFARLREVAPGDEVVVADAHGGSVTYVVDRVEIHGKDAFPSLDVYGVTAEPTLRLITCGGGFDTASRRYLDNVVVYATVAPSPPAGSGTGGMVTIQ